MRKQKKDRNKPKAKDKKSREAPGGKTYTGIVDIARSGMGFVVVDGLEKDIRVHPGRLRSALDGDEVRVKIQGGGKSSGRMEGEITEVLRRSKTDFTGKLELSKEFAFLLPDKEGIPDIYLPLDSLNGARHGDQIVVHITHWGGQGRRPSGTVTAVLDKTNLNDTAMKGILVENGFPLSFPTEVMKEVLALPETVSKAETARRKDFREVFTVTIDPVDAKDFDDAISIRSLRRGVYEIGIHIADVSHYVLPGTALDEEAYKRATSVYLADRVLPMLPEKISNELCSLRPHEDKLAFSAVFEIGAKAAVRNCWIGRTVIHSNHRFTYEEVQDIVETGKGLHSKELLLLNDISQQLRSRRFEQGAINFSSQEVRFQLDEDAVPVGVVIKENKEAHQLIEELMLLANKTVAEYAAKIRVQGQEIPFPYRVHDVPDEEKLKLFTAFAAKFGYKFDVSSPQSIARSFNEMLEKVRGRAEQHVLEQLGIRTMSKAVYTTENIGHYGLGFGNYCHFTSPIRRYPDVLVHRIIAAHLEKQELADRQLEKKCRHCSERERKAMDAERAANKYKQVEYMQQFIGEEFDGVISGVAHFGFWVETVDSKCEGMVGIADLQELDDFVYSDTEYALIGSRTHKRFRMGDTVRIQVAAASLEKRQLDYVLAGGTEPAANKKEIRNASTDKEKKGRKGKRRKAS
ncbi:ribonuclease R [Compostibacter hankyongensis]|uniref:Ribonuclease R n=1 Tax=Compostibacter hankyongensis TaxID=1007089 RepID=A0ABP8FN38_9BACT